METWYLKSVVGDAGKAPPAGALPFALEQGGPWAEPRRDFTGPVVLAMGVFDGVHVGHREVVDRALETARLRRLPCAVFTFVEHPRSVLRPDRPVPLLTPWREKRERLADLGVDLVVAAHFTPAFSGLSAEDFVRGLLVELLQVRHLVVGFNFRFGRHAAGSPELLRLLAGDLGFDLDVLPPFECSARPVSSSQIRELLATGFLDDAIALLGGPYRLAGLVVGGDGRARQLGYPTANLWVDDQKLLPAHGVYAGKALWSGGSRRCVVNIGIRPTFNPPQLKVEAHLLDFEGDLYGQNLTIELEAHIRPERAFPSVAALVEQISDDVAKARSHLATAEAR